MTPADRPRVVVSTPAGHRGCRPARRRRHRRGGARRGRAGRRSRRHAPDGSARRSSSSTSNREHPSSRPLRSLRARPGCARRRACPTGRMAHSCWRRCAAVCSRSSVNPTGCTICGGARSRGIRRARARRPISSCPRWTSSGGSPGGRRRRPRCRRLSRPASSEILALLAEGLTTQQIGRRLGISPRTVEAHVAQALSEAGRHDAGPGDRSSRVAGSHRARSLGALSTAASAADSGRERSSNPARHLQRNDRGTMSTSPRARRPPRPGAASAWSSLTPCPWCVPASACSSPLARGHRAARRSRDRGRGAAGDRTRPPFARRRAGRTRARRATRRRRG